MYSLASLIAYFVGCSFTGKAPASYEDIFEADTKHDSHTDNELAYIREAMTDYANEYNKRLKEK